MSELLKILMIVKWLSESDRDMSSMREALDVSSATFNRYLSEARHLGAKITAYQSDKKWWYRLENWPQCEKIVTQWIALEEKRSFV